MNPDQNQPEAPWTPQQPAQPPEPVQPQQPIQEVQPQDFSPNSQPQPQPATIPQPAPQPPINPVQTQPVYQPQPVQPFGPTPSVAGYPGGPAPQPPRKSKKGLIITLISVGAVLIIAAVFIVLYFTLWTVRPQDYKAAADITSEFSSLDKTSRADIEKALDPSSATSVDDLNDISNKAEASLKKYEDAVKKLDGQRAFRDDSVNKLYVTYKDKFKAYDEFVSNYLESAKIGRTAVLACSEDSKKFNDSGDYSYDNYKKTYSDPCKAELAKASNLKDEDLNKVISSYVTYLNEGEPVVKKMFDAFAKNDTASGTSALNELKPIATKYTDANKAASDNIKKRYDATKGTTDASDDLLKALNAKAN